jgi:hypothetical protein
LAAASIKPGACQPAISFRFGARTAPHKAPDQSISGLKKDHGIAAGFCGYKKGLAQKSSMQENPSLATSLHSYDQDSHCNHYRIRQTMTASMRTVAAETLRRQVSAWRLNAELNDYLMLRRGFGQ